MQMKNAFSCGIKDLPKIGLQRYNQILDVYIIYVTLLQSNVYNSEILQSEIPLSLSNCILLYISKTV